MEVTRSFYKARMNELVRYVTTEQYGSMMYLTLVRGKKEVIFQFKKDDFKSNLVMDMLEEIQNHIRSIEWTPDAPNWVYMNRRGDKTRSLRVFQKSKKQDSSLIKEQPWARMVHENEIDFDVYGPCELRFGKWRGREVDIYRVSMDQDLPFLNRAMKAYRRLQGMNMTYDMLAHVLDDEGNIVGIMTEPMVGRQIEARDEDLVTKSLRKLIEIGYILDSPNTGSMLVTDKGELRLTQLHNVLELSKDPEERKKRIQSRQKVLQDVFLSLDQWGSGPSVGLMTRGRLSIPVRILVPQSDPEKLLKGTNEWLVERVRDRWAVDQQPRLKLVKSGGVKRLLEIDSSDEEKEEKAVYGDKRHRRTKKLRSLVESPEVKTICKYEAPLPRLPVAREDLPLVPPPVFGYSGYDSSRTSPATPPVESGIPSWLLEGDWLVLAKTRFATVE